MCVCVSERERRRDEPTEVPLLLLLNTYSSSVYKFFEHVLLNVERREREKKIEWGWKTKKKKKKTGERYRSNVMESRRKHERDE